MSTVSLTETVRGPEAAGALQYLAFGLCGDHRLAPLAGYNALMASHSIDLCRAMCNKALLPANGQRVFFGDIEEGSGTPQNKMRCLLLARPSHLPPRP